MKNSYKKTLREKKKEAKRLAPKTLEFKGAEIKFDEFPDSWKKLVDVHEGGGFTIHRAACWHQKISETTGICLECGHDQRSAMSPSALSKLEYTELHAKLDGCSDIETFDGLMEELTLQLLKQPDFTWNYYGYSTSSSIPDLVTQLIASFMEHARRLCDVPITAFSWRLQGICFAMHTLIYHENINGKGITFKEATSEVADLHGFL